MKTMRHKIWSMLFLSAFGLFLCEGMVGLQARSLTSDPSILGDATPVYQSFFDGNPVYYQTWENNGADAAAGLIKKHGLEGDTVVDGRLYHLLSVMGVVAARVQFWVRESENHDKVWVRMPWDSLGRETLVVDMNLKERDSFQMYGYGEWVREGDSSVYCPKATYYIVDSVYYQNHPGGTLKHIRLKPLGYNGYTQILESTPVNQGQCDWKSRHLEFIEGVGSNLGFVYGRNGMRLGVRDPLWKYLYQHNSEHALLDYIVCVEKDSVVYYKHPNVECVDCWDYELFQELYTPIYPPYANESVRSLSRYLRVSPNPAQERVTLQWASEASVAGVCRIELYTLQGVKLRSFMTDSWPYTLDVSALPHGTYMLRVSPAAISASATESPAIWQATVRLIVL